jgi:hypothetical protein
MGVAHTMAMKFSADAQDAWPNVAARLMETISAPP